MLASAFVVQHIGEEQAMNWPKAIRVLEFGSKVGSAVEFIPTIAVSNNDIHQSRETLWH